ncbi:MAG: hypothetical protein AAGU11_18725 [Syntrophobacteraceae bacterium]
MLTFSTGVMFAVPFGAALPTPRRFGHLEEISLDFSFTTKELHGRMQIPVDISRAEGKFTGKAKTGKFNGKMLAEFFWGVTPSTGQIKVADLEPLAIPGSVAYTVTVANAATFRTDLGVQSAAGVPFVRVEANPTVGQYAVNTTTGVYTFAEADKSTTVYASYLYTATTGVTMEMTNKVMGITPEFSLFLTGEHKGDQTTCLLHRVTSSKLTFPKKMNDYTVPEFDFSIMENGTGSAGTWTFAR